MRPSIGRIVHFTAIDPLDDTIRVCAALVTRVNETDVDKHSVSLRVFNVEESFVRRYVEYTNRKAGTKEAISKWTWPERVK